MDTTAKSVITASASAQVAHPLILESSDSAAGAAMTPISSTAWTNYGQGITLPAIGNGGTWILSANSRIVYSTTGPANSYGVVVLRLWDQTTGKMVPNSSIVFSAPAGTSGQNSIAITPVTYAAVGQHTIVLQALTVNSPGANMTAQFYSDENGGTNVMADMNPYNYFSH